MLRGRVHAAESAYYTFRVGAYANGSGIRFSDEFLNATQDLSPMQRVESLGQNTQNRGSVLQLSVRKESSYVTVFSEGSSASQGTTTQNILEPLDSSVLAEQIAGLLPIKESTTLPGFHGLSERTVEGSVRFLRGEGLAQGLRNSITNDRFILTLLYGDTEAGNELAPKGPDMARKVYGSGFRPTFGYGHALARSLHWEIHRTTPREASRERLNGLSEINLLDGRNTNRAWICPPELRFLGGAGRGLGCSTRSRAGILRTSVVNPNALSGNLRIAYDVARTVLRPEDWHVDVVRRCVVPRKSTTACYEQDQGKVNYYGGLGGTSNCGMGDGRIHQSLSTDWGAEPNLRCDVPTLCVDLHPTVIKVF